MMKRGQAGLEFLSNYGWTLFMIILVIGGLFVFGNIKPRDVIPDRCVLPAGFYCEEYSFRSLPNNNVNVTVIFRNQFGESITLVDATMLYENRIPLSVCSFDSFILGEGFGKISCISTGVNVSYPGERATATFSFEFTPTGKSLNQEVSGTVYGTVR